MQVYHLSSISTWERSSLQQTQAELSHLSHLKEKMPQHVNPITLDWLKNAAINVFERKLSSALLEMFSIELNFTIDALRKWFCNFYKSRFVKIGTLTKQKYEKNHAIDLAQRKRVMRNIRILISSSFGPLSEQMTFYDFVVKKTLGLKKYP